MRMWMRSRAERESGCGQILTGEAAPAAPAARRGLTLLILGALVSTIERHEVSQEASGRLLIGRGVDAVKVRVKEDVLARRQLRSSRALGNLARLIALLVGAFGPALSKQIGAFAGHGWRGGWVGCGGGWR
jgi:hypothetical protein